MIVLHVNTHDRGGAANAAIRLHRALLDENVNSEILFLRNTGSSVERSHYFTSQPVSLGEQLRRRLNLFSNSLKTDFNKQLAQLPVGYEGYSLPTTSFALEDSPLVKIADIIHLHWVSRFMDYSFFQRINKPVVWTVHDMNPFLGGFHYQNDAQAFAESFDELEHQLIKYKQQMLANNQWCTIVAPSEYLRSASLSSSIFAQYPHKVIRNSLNLDTFKPYPQSTTRRLWNLPDNKTIILFVSEDIQNKRKGFDLLLAAFNELPSEQSEKLVLCAVGQKNRDLPPQVRYLGHLRDEMLLALAYSAVDLFVLPSREDNLPNTMLEALACGTPVLSFATGGMADVIKTGLNGVLLQETTSIALAAALTDLLKGTYTFERQQIRQFAEEYFSPARQAQAYLEVYRKIVA